MFWLKCSLYLTTGHDYIENIACKYEDVRWFKVPGTSMVSTGNMHPNLFGGIQTHVKNIPLIDYIGFEYVINKKFVPYIMMPKTFGINNEDWSEKSRVFVKRANGKIQNAVLDINGGLIIENDRIILKVQYSEIENVGDEPIHYITREFGPNDKTTSIVSEYRIMEKYITIGDFLKLNPGFKFHICVIDPLKNANIVKYVPKEHLWGDDDIIDKYHCLNLYFRFQLIEYFKMVHNIFSEETKDAFQYDIYTQSSERFLQVKAEFLDRGMDRLRKVGY